MRSLDDPILTTAAGPPSRLESRDVLPVGEAPELRGFVRWWQRVISVLQSASSSTDFFQKAAESIVDLVGLDMGAVFLRGADDWQTAASAGAAARRARPSTRVLGKVLAERRTFWNSGAQQVDALSSLAHLEAYVAAPILDRQGDVLGVLYGHRVGEPGKGIGLSELEALLVETLACGVAAGLARMAQEEAAIRQRVTFGQFFSPELAARLESEPDLLRGRDVEISTLFCDIRGFSAVSERLGPGPTMEWIGAVLSVLSDQVVAAGGVLVDYVGDELMAMWGAPTSQPNHATLACNAAQAMLAASAELDERWSALVGGPTRFGIGINSAMARVGNTGSVRKFKYGPLGNGVNLASRVQSATKFLRVNALITGATQRMLDDCFRLRRLCAVQVVNIAEPVELFELDGGIDARVCELFPAYEDALVAFEAGDFSRAARLLGAILDAFPGDGPTLVLLSRAVEAMVTNAADFSPVWRLPGK
jgi:adenylate cyclase